MEDVYTEYEKSGKDWHGQKSVTVRFTSVVDEAALRHINEQVIGVANRERDNRLLTLKQGVNVVESFHDDLSMRKVTAYAVVVYEELRKKHEAAQAYFQAQRFQAAEAAFEEMVRAAESLAVAAPDGETLKQRIARGRLNAAGCALCLQNPDARERLRQVADHYLCHLQPQARVQLSMSLAQMGDLERARRVLPADDSDETKGAAQLIEVVEGRLPDRPWASSSILRMHIAGALVDHGELDEAGRMARELLLEDPEDVLLVFYSVCILQTALGRSVHEEPPLVRPIPIDERRPTVEAIERHLETLSGLPPALAGDLRRVRFNYFYLAGDDEQREAAKAELGDDWRTVAGSRPRYELDLLEAEALARDGITGVG